MKGSPVSVADGAQLIPLDTFLKMHVKSVIEFKHKSSLASLPFRTWKTGYFQHMLTFEDREWVSLCCSSSDVKIHVVLHALRKQWRRSLPGFGLDPDCHLHGGLGGKRSGRASHATCRSVMETKSSTFWDVVPVAPRAHWECYLQPGLE